MIGRRTAAFLADGIGLAWVAFALARRRTRPRSLVVVATVAGTALVGIPYHVFLEGTVGQTVGKRLFGIVVRRTDGTECTLGAAGVRTVLRAVDWLPAAYLLGFISMATSERNQRLGDRCAGTVVVRSADAAANDREVTA